MKDKFSIISWTPSRSHDARYPRHFKPDSLSLIWSDLPLIYLILNNFDGIDCLPELILLPRVLVETLTKLLDRLVHFPEVRGFNLGCITYPN